MLTFPLLEVQTRWSLPGFISSNFTITNRQYITLLRAFYTFFRGRSNNNAHWQLKQRMIDCLPFLTELLSRMQGFYKTSEIIGASDKQLVWRHVQSLPDSLTVLPKICLAKNIKEEAGRRFTLEVMWSRSLSFFLSFSFRPSPSPRCRASLPCPIRTSLMANNRCLGTTARRLITSPTMHSCHNHCFCLGIPYYCFSYLLPIVDHDFSLERWVFSLEIENTCFCMHSLF